MNAYELRSATIELASVFAECRAPDWDGYGALPVTPQAWLHAERFLEMVATDSPPPTIGAEPDGQITMEWGSQRGRRLSVSISPDGDFHYAAILGSSTRHGTERQFEVVPEPVVSWIRAVT